MNILRFILCDITVSLKFFHVLNIGKEVPDYDHYVIEDFTIATTDDANEGFTTSDCTIRGLRLLQTFAGVLQKKIHARTVFKKTPTNCINISTERL